jgi:uncharacterized membrane protein
MLVAGMIQWTLWNLLLAALPVVIAFPLAAEVRRTRGERPRWLLVAALATVWLAFLPNACYLLTEWRHYLFNPFFQAARDRGNPTQFSVYRVVRHTAFFAGYSMYGMLCFVVAIRRVETSWRSIGRGAARLAVPLFFLTSLGVYLGLVIRLNSWDIVTRPYTVVAVSCRALLQARSLALISAFAAMLWAAYQMFDIWMDGLALRVVHLRAAVLHSTRGYRVIPR